mmetsp:Transcript_5589/g.15993  ORF Transcript_5589/g.15993 Transcript_5589/m.15993 type:complete len:331 (-) Transcript_5589:1259-2251(-)|eukprot:CAMPEP_0206142684 /NCGR_PEP_ID=MMETSP1473-20131121/17884_1 /ASSEMBLY_ACC=CAM_ASM_001109 /TAXON_ID=1461547 /ORGANISM="Stichococcus sp, Strain RCC1054" /LENGTH=330 /DNA_ID=CAMNT_0053537781 /DNA_START=96 /DNA_END=1088 /DNA_ORIENTATION=-
MQRARDFRRMQCCLSRMLSNLNAAGPAADCCRGQSCGFFNSAPLPQMQAAPDRLSGGSFAIMALAPALGSQMQDRRFSRFTELSGTAMMHTLGAGAQGAAYAAAQRLGASHALVPPSLSDGGRRSMGKKGKSKSKGGGGGQAADAEAGTGAASLDFTEEKLLMDACLLHLENQLRAMRSGRASPGMLEGIKVEAYGDKAPLAALATVGARDAQLLVASVYDPETTAAVEKAIRASPLGLNPRVEGQEILIPVPKPSADTLEAMAKLCKQEVEAAKVSVRNARKQGLVAIKGLAGEDDKYRAETQLQKLTDQYIKTIEDKGAKKAKDIMTI